MFLPDANCMKSLSPSEGSLRRLRTGAWSWLINSRFADSRFLERLERPRELMLPPAQLIERTPPRPSSRFARLVLPEWPDLPLFIKFHKPRGFWASCKDCFRHAPARRAFANALRLQELGIATATPVAVGERFRLFWWREAFQISSEVPEAVTLNRAYSACVDRQRRLLLVRSLARTMARLHDARFSHFDPHSLNFLVSRSDFRTPVLVDLDALRYFGPWFTSRTALKDLRRMLQRSPLSAHEHLWFIATYCRVRAEKPSARELVRRLGRHAQGQRRRAVVTSQLTPQTSGLVRWLVRTDLPEDPLRNVLAHPEEWLRDPSRYFKNSRNVTIARLPGTAGSGWVLRRLNYGKLSHRLRDFFRPARTQRAFHSGLLLEQAGIATARVLAAGEERRLRWPLRAYLLTEEIPGAVTLAALLQQAHRQTRQAVGHLAILLAQLHNHGFSHRDLKATNVLFDNQLRPHLIDLDGVRRVRFGVRARAVADLARLAQDVPSVSVHLMVRFLKTYCHGRRADDWRRWWRAIQKRSQT